MEVPKKDGLYGKIPLKGMIWGYQMGGFSWVYTSKRRGRRTSHTYGISSTRRATQNDPEILRLEPMMAMQNLITAESRRFAGLLPTPHMRN